MRTSALMICLASLGLAQPAAAGEAFKNLPGVKDPAKQKRVELDVVCSSRIEQRWPSRFPQRNGLGERTYSCGEGDLSSGSNRAPNLIEYRKFKEYYQR